MLPKIDNEPAHTRDLSKSANEFNWYILYTRPRAEKVAYEELVRRNYEVFLPVKKTYREWKNRQKKIIEQVLFPSYIFVNTRQHELYNIKRTEKIVTYIQTGGKPSVIPINDIEGIKKMLCSGQEVSIETNFSEGDRVRIVSGPLSGYEGFLVNQKNRAKFGIQLKEINHSMFIDICVEVLEKI